MRSWGDAGVALTVEVSTSGDLVNPTRPPMVSIAATTPPATTYTLNGTSHYGTGTLPTSWGSYWSTPSPLPTFTVDKYGTTLNYSGSMNSANSRIGVNTAGSKNVLAGHAYLIEVDVRRRAAEPQLIEVYGLWRYNDASTPTRCTSIVPVSGSVDEVVTVRAETQVAWTGGARWPTDLYVRILGHVLNAEESGSPITVTGLSYRVEAVRVYDLDSPASTWNPSLTWRDISCDLHALQIRYGRNEFTDRFETASATLELNNDDGEYAFQNTWGFRPGRVVRVTATRKAVAYPLYLGLVDTIDGAVDVDGRSTARVGCHDPTSIMATPGTPQIAVGTGTSASLVPRMNALLDYVGWAASNRDLDPSPPYLLRQIQASGRAIREELGLSAESAVGFLYCDRVGHLVYRNNGWPFDETWGSVVQANFHAEPADAYAAGTQPGSPVLGEGARWGTARWGTDVWAQSLPSDIPNTDGIATAAGAPEVCLAAVTTEWSNRDVVNYVDLANAEGRAQLWEDRSSQAEYGIRSHSRHDLLGAENDNLEPIATRLLAARAHAPWRLVDMTYSPLAQADDDDDDLWRFTLSCFLGWMVRVRYYNLRRGWHWQTVTLVQAIEHRIDPSSWSTTLVVDDGPVRAQ